jgi:hypothetical protein
MWSYCRSRLLVQAACGMAFSSRCRPLRCGPSPRSTRCSPTQTGDNVGATGDWSGSRCASGALNRGSCQKTRAGSVVSGGRRGGGRGTGSPISGGISHHGLESEAGSSQLSVGSAVCVRPTNGPPEALAVTWPGAAGARPVHRTRPPCCPRSGRPPTGGPGSPRYSIRGRPLRRGYIA